MSKVWQDWTHAEGLQHEYGSCEVLQVRTERAYWRECQASSPKSASSSPSSSTGKVQVQPRPSLQRKLDEEKVVARERCMKFSAEGPQEEEQNLEKRL